MAERSDLDVLEAFIVYFLKGFDKIKCKTEKMSSEGKEAEQSFSEKRFQNEGNNS